MRTYVVKPANIERKWHLVDADQLVLGRLATQVAHILRGKHQPFFSPHLDTGDHVVVINAAKLIMTSNKAQAKYAYSHSGYPGALTRISYEKLLTEHPDQLVMRAVKGMLPRGPLGDQMLTKLKVYAGPDHPHAAQRPVLLELPSARRTA
ncbi:MAG: 50S ribosomal protein L13 [Firmicutes bacterium]|nr:50S ribosomal protein L13 [Bacillota bacterium]